VYRLIPVIASVAARPGDEQDLVLLRERRHLHRHAGRHRAGQDRDALADQVDRGRDGMVRLTTVVDDLELDRAAVDRAGAVRGVVQPGLQAGQVGVAVAREQARRRGDDAHPDRIAVGYRLVGVCVVLGRIVLGRVTSVAGVISTTGGHGQHGRRGHGHHPTPPRGTRSCSHSARCRTHLVPPMS
jgi:hypothetical protein